MIYLERSDVVMLKLMPRNDITIRNLIDDYINLNDERFNKIIQTLASTKKFLADTAPDYQKEREKFITKDQIQQILDTAGEGLNIFRNISEQELNDFKEVLVYCRLILLERLELLQQRHDKIFDHYIEYDNALKSGLIFTNKYNFDK